MLVQESNERKLDKWTSQMKKLESSTNDTERSKFSVFDSLGNVLWNEKTQSEIEACITDTQLSLPIRSYGPV